MLPGLSRSFGRETLSWNARGIGLAAGQSKGGLNHVYCSDDSLIVMPMHASGAIMYVGLGCWSWRGKQI